MSVLRLARVVEGSRANGPGERMVVWTQGCLLACPGCQNTGTWDRLGGGDVSVAELLARYATATNLRGLTLSGGEPFAQAAAAAELAEGVRRLGGDVVCFSGHTLDELHGADAARLLASIDLLVDGPWVAERRLRGVAMRASENQMLHFLGGRIQANDLHDIPEAEWLGSEGGGVASGIGMLRLAAILARIEP